MDRMRTLQVIN